MRVAILLPCLNEADALPAVLAGLAPAVRDGARVIVCDNGSTDGSREIARSLGANIATETRRGYGGAVLAGIAAITGDPPDVVVMMDADHSNYAEDLPALLGPILRGEAELVLGERMTLGDVRALTPQQRAGNALATALIRARTGRAYRDLGPFRAIRWEALRGLAMEDQTWGWNVEMQIKAVRRGLRVVEVPVRNRARIGESKISGTVSGVVRAGAKIVWACWRYG